MSDRFLLFLGKDIIEPSFGSMNDAFGGHLSSWVCFALCVHPENRSLGLDGPQALGVREQKTRSRGSSDIRTHLDPEREQGTGVSALCWVEAAQEHSRGKTTSLMESLKEELKLRGPCWPNGGHSHYNHWPKDWGCTFWKLLVLLPRTAILWR